MKPLSAILAVLTAVIPPEPPARVRPYGTTGRVTIESRREKNRKRAQLRRRKK